MSKAPWLTLFVDRFPNEVIVVTEPWITVNHESLAIELKNLLGGGVIEDIGNSLIGQIGEAFFRY